MLGRLPAAARVCLSSLSQQSLHAVEASPHLSPSVGCMNSWQIHQYGGIGELQQSASVRIPVLEKPSEVLVQVHASSINPFDVAMIAGYGSRTMNVLRALDCGLRGSLEFPLTPGRDFSGVVMETGHGVKSIKPGDAVWGTLGPQRRGSHAQYVTCSECALGMKPSSLTHVEAGSLPYVAMTAWSALTITAELSERSARGRRVLVLGGSGGVGTFAVQLLKAWGAEVTATCSLDAIPLVESLGADLVIDYTTPDAEESLREVKGFDIILDCSPDMSTRYLPLLSSWKYSKYVTLRPPLLKNIDNCGLVLGMAANAAELLRDNITSHSEGKTFRWAFFMPNGCAMDRVRNLVEAGKISPVVEKVIGFDDLPSGYQQVKEGHNRGKVVLDVMRNSFADEQHHD